MSINQKTVYFSLSSAVFTLLGLYCINLGFFWDSIQQIGKEASVFFSSDSFLPMLPPATDTSVGGTGYHIPFLPYLTALLWHVFGRHLWVSHALALLAAIPFIISVWRIVSVSLPSKYHAVGGLILLSEPVTLSQFAQASPDFFMLVSLSVAIAALLDKRVWLLSVALTFLCLFNMRGVIACACFSSALFIACLCHRHSWSFAIKAVAPPFLIILTYYSVYLLTYGWFFSSGSSYSEHYSTPSSLSFILHHVASLLLRMLEQGRFLIWLLLFVLAFRRGIFSFLRTLFSSHPVVSYFISFFLAVYLLFAFATQMPFGGRYFMLLHFAVSLVALSFLLQTRLARLFASLIIVTQLSGHFWIYPEKTAQPWDTTLLFTEYYSLKSDFCAKLQELSIPASEVASGFVLSADPNFAFLTPDPSSFLSAPPSSARYYAYSNLCNEDDDFIDDLKSNAHLVFSLHNGAMFISLYDRMP